MSIPVRWLRVYTLILMQIFYAVCLSEELTHETSPGASWDMLTGQSKERPLKVANTLMKKEEPLLSLFKFGDVLYILHPGVAILRG